ncbi:hypothetical protein E5A73_20470 [Sphingomonas gei]|uniref:PHP domain-containing protein n=1 Tax=Sphingomonas gei TaxID=1395960 RepID=A0A4S1WYM7_9SPHN|nr:hypothetical protein [Sphingomonas gei]TGX48684.1 hypothetical protein E5A73_20470 [Sphingomonas gei]
MLGIPNARCDSRAAYRVTVRFDQRDRLEASAAIAEPRIVDAPAAAGLDFIAATDHNNTAHFGGLREFQPWFDKLLLIPGIEITTFGGHVNISDPRRFVDFRVGSEAVPDVGALQRGIADARAIMSINHPALPSGERCMAGKGSPRLGPPLPSVRKAPGRQRLAKSA